MQKKYKILKVLQIIDQLKTGGAERVAVDLSILLSKERNIDLTFLCLLDKTDLDQELISNNIPIIYLYRKNKYNPFTLLKLFRIVNDYDVVHIHLRQVMRYVGLLFYLPVKMKCKIIFHDHYGQIASDKEISGLLKKSIQKGDAYIGVSSTLVVWAKEKILNSHIFLLPNIVRKETQLKKVNNPTDLVAVGNFRPQKNYEFLCLLLKELPNEVAITIYGKPIDKPYFNKINNLINEYKMVERVFIITNENNVASTLRNYKLAIHTADSETGPLVAIEYMSQGLPFICFKTGEVINSLIKEDDTLIMNTFEVEDWKAKIIQILNNTEIRNEKSKMVENVYHKEYSEIKYVSTCLSVYSEILKKIGD